MRYLHDGERDNHISELLRHEALACEGVMRSQHPNIVDYFGCLVKNDRIVSICLKKYTDTLSESIDSHKQIDKKRCLRDIENGIKHMHALGFAHNDINPHNIMFDSDGTAVIIDFDSCRPLGEELGTKSGTLGFFVEKTTMSKEANDLYALEKIEEYLNEKP